MVSVQVFRGTGNGKGRICPSLLEEGDSYEVDRKRRFNFLKRVIGNVIFLFVLF